MSADKGTVHTGYWDNGSCMNPIQITEEQRLQIISAQSVYNKMLFNKVKQAIKDQKAIHELETKHFEKLFQAEVRAMEDRENREA